MHRIAGLLILLVYSVSHTHAQSPSPAATEGFSLLPGDVVRVEIWREKDLSGEFVVSEAGVVTLPMLGDRHVIGIAIERLRDSLIEEYRAQLRNPSITITPLRRVSVLGEVQEPGQYPVDPTVSLAGVVALAGGATPEGDLQRIRIVRDGRVILGRVDAGRSLTSIDIRSGDEIFVERRSWLDRNSVPLIGTGLSVLGSIITTLIIINSQ